MSINLFGSWLCSTVCETTDGRITFKALKGKFEEATSGTSTISDKKLSQIVFRLFPNRKILRGRSGEDRYVIYVGLSWKENRDTNLVSPWSVQCHLKHQSMLFEQTATSVIVFMMSDVVCNGNIVMKEITLNFKEHLWELKIRGRKVVLEDLDITKTFDCTTSNLHEIFEIVHKIKICTGIETEHKTKVPIHIISERIGERGEENKQNFKMRSKTCKQVVGWSCTGDSCNTCINNLNAFKNEKTDVIDLNKVDEEDLKKILKQVFPGASQEMQDFLRSQHDILNSSKITWDKSVIKTCLSLWSRSVKCYEQLRDSNIFKLPSGRQLRRYKSSVEQKPGVSNDVLRWMRNTAIQVNVPPSGYHGGLLHDEAKIQEDLVLNVKGERSELVGWIDTGSEAENLRIVKENKVSRKLATDVLQITFLGYTGFRFPIAHYPTDGVKASELYIIIWNLISQLQSWGFIVDFIMQDGGQQNREFTKLHFTGEPRKNHFMCDSLVNPDRKVYHCQDFSHNMKKLRNAVFSSGINTYNTKLLNKKGNVIVWEQWLNAARWDEQTNSRKIHYKLSNSHLHPDSAEKMRNHLAEEVLNEDMLQLMKSYQNSLINGDVLNSAIDLLQQTSKLITVFRDPRPVTDIHDARLNILNNALDWFNNWRNEIKQIKKTPKELERMLPSIKCLDDVESMIVVFTRVCRIHITEFKGRGVYPSRFNSDLAENIFCQQRGLYNGNSTNPNYYVYCNTMNSVILGQTTKSRARKSNAGLPTTDPYSFHVDVPLSKKKKTLCRI